MCVVRQTNLQQTFFLLLVLRAAHLRCCQQCVKIARANSSMLIDWFPSSTSVKWDLNCMFFFTWEFQLLPILRGAHFSFDWVRLENVNVMKTLQIRLLFVRSRDKLPSQFASFGGNIWSVQVDISFRRDSGWLDLCAANSDRIIEKNNAESTPLRRSTSALAIRSSKGIPIYFKILFDFFFFLYQIDLNRRSAVLYNATSGLKKRLSKRPSSNRPFFQVNLANMPIKSRREKRLLN